MGTKYAASGFFLFFVFVTPLKAALGYIMCTCTLFNLPVYWGAAFRGIKKMPQAYIKRAVYQCIFVYPYMHKCA